MRRTIGCAVTICGTGLHTGAHTTVVLEPAVPGAGLRLCRADIPRPSVALVTLDAVECTERRTTLRVGTDTVSTVEHLFSALAAHAIDDVTILVDGPEFPQCDGSAVEYAKALGRAGVRMQDGARTRYIIEETLHVALGEASYTAQPSDCYEVDVSIAWDHPLVGEQSFASQVTRELFDGEIAAARTFGFVEEIDALRSRGLIRGVSSHSVIALSADGIVHGHPLRWTNEFARHKALDVLGDLALLGGGLRAKIVAHRPSHGGNVMLAKAIRERARQVFDLHKPIAGGSY